MFFLLSKLLAFIITPAIWIFSALLYALFLKDAVRKKKALITTLVLFYVFSNSFLLDEAMRKWEVPATHYKDLTHYEVGIVLGGMLSYDSDFERIQFNRGSDRLMQALELYKKGYISKIFFVGGSGSILHPEIKEGPLVKKYLLTLGIPEEDILVETESNNTRENALYSLDILKNKIPKGEYLLITSGFHMRRAMACFKKVGIEAVPYSTDRFSGPRKFEFDHLLIPNEGALGGWNRLLHEIVGYWVYRASGYA